MKTFSYLVRVCYPNRCPDGVFWTPMRVAHDGDYRAAVKWAQVCLNDPYPHFFVIRLPAISIVADANDF